MISENNKEFIIEKLTELLIKADYHDKQVGKDTYVKKTRIYQDLIYMFKNLL